MSDYGPTDDGSGKPCEHCGKVWLHGDCYTTKSRLIRCIAQPQVESAPPNDGSEP